MRAFGSVPSRPELVATSPRAGGRGPVWPIYLLAAGYFLLHLPYLPQSLEDIDTINFALGLRHFDPALHQPHPPGYPVYRGFYRRCPRCASKPWRWRCGR